MEGNLAPPRSPVLTHRVCAPPALAVRHVSESNPWLGLLTPEQLVEISGAFKKFDLNGDGTIDTNEIQTVMTNLGYPKTLEEAKAIVADVDTDGNGTIEFDEFLGMIAARMIKADGVDELQTAFSVMFEDGTGYVPRHPAAPFSVPPPSPSSLEASSPFSCLPPC